METLHHSNMIQRASCRCFRSCPFNLNYKIISIFCLVILFILVVYNNIDLVNPPFLVSSEFSAPKLTVKSLNGKSHANDISCHEYPEYMLPSNEDASFSPPGRSIFFIETSCRGGFDSRQACSIESAVRANPANQVYVLLSGPLHNDTMTSEPYLTLTSMPNLQFIRIHPKTFSEGTPLESFFEKNLLDPSPHKVSHCSDALRLLTLNKYGGFYLDLDILVVKSFATLPDSFVWEEDKGAVASSVLAFSKFGIGKRFTDAGLKDIASTYRPSEWAYNGPALILRTLKDICKQTNLSKISEESCDGLHLYGAKYFGPIHYWENNKYFAKETWEVKEEYTHHIWNHMTADKEVTKGTVYDGLAQTFCPQIYTLYGNDFGL